jgi:ATP-binding cassette subfamily F protein uup
LIQDFSTRVLRGDRVAIVGPNGAGKTTLVRILLGEIAPDAGTVQLGANLDIVYVDQARADLAGEATLWSALAPLGGDQVMVQGQPRHVAAYARDFLFREDQLRQPVASLSGGERNRLLLARALARPSNVLVLDEPTNDLDMETLDLLEEMLADYRGTLILVSHDRDFIDRLATSTIALDGAGHAVETPGGWRDFLTQNPGFLTPAPEAPPRTPDRKAKAAVSRPAAPAAKLSFKDQRRLAELEAHLAALPADIGRIEREMADPGLYGRDPKAFERLTAALDAARAKLAAAEEGWLELEALKEDLARGPA